MHSPKPLSRRTLLRSSATAAVAVVGSAEAGAAQTPDAAPGTAVPVDQGESPDQRADLLLQQMTLEEKIGITHGVMSPDYAFYMPPMPDLGIPALTMADGPSGVRVANRAANGGTATAMPATIALAATWDRDLAQRYGDLVGSEAWATGHNVQLGPGADIARVAVGGRVFESFGEDPYLSGQCAASYVTGVQSHPVSACVKHYSVYNQEIDRTTLDARVSERAIQEIYIPGFAAAVQEGDADVVMGAFNLINGAHACENRLLLTDILRQQLGFPGFVISDYGAARDTVESANAGLDQEQPSERVYGAALQAAVESGRVGMDTLDTMVRRILRTMFARGLFDQPIDITPLPEQEQEHGQVAREIAAAGIVLLKNSDQLLPLATGSVRSIAVIGADADNASAAGGGSGLVAPTYTVSPLEAIRERAGDGVLVEHAPGTDPVSAAALLPGPPPVPSSVLAPPDAEAGDIGLLAEYWENSNFEGQPSLARVEPHADLNFGFFVFQGFNAGSPNLPPTPSVSYPGARPSVRWTGTLTAPATGDYVLALTSLGTSRLELDGRELILNRGSELLPKETTVALVAGEPHEVRIDYATDAAGMTGNMGAQVRFGWEPPTDAIPPQVQQAADLASRSDVAVVVVRDYESEEMDRPNLRLPNGQDQLIREVAVANPNTIVVVQTGAAVTMPWLDDVGAVVQAWYGGQEQGNAIADVLFGDVNPSARLPLTFPQTDEDTPIRTTAQYPGELRVVDYSEDIFVGYRGFDQLEIEPLFPFGHGLSYTTFTYADLRVESPGPTTATPAPNTGHGTAARLTFTVTNSGETAGAEIAQVYVGRFPVDVPTPPKQLAGFVKVDLAPGQRQDVTVDVSRRSLSYWDTACRAWATPTGETAVYVGSSSRDIRLEGTITIA